MSTFRRITAAVVLAPAVLLAILFFFVTPQRVLGSNMWAWIAIIAYLAIVAIYFIRNYVHTRREGKATLETAVGESPNERQVRHRADVRRFRAPSIPVDLAFAVIALVVGFSMFILAAR